MQARQDQFPRRPGEVIRVAALLIFLPCAGAFGQSATDPQFCEDFEQYRNIRTAEPSRPEMPLRRDNITDEEVREVQSAALEVYPDSIVSISGVTDGCDCEDGSRCTAQVWLALSRANKTRSLVLSKIDGHWKIGAVQSWWLQYQAHQASYPGLGRGAKQLAWQQESQRLFDNFPTCPAPTANCTMLRGDSHSSTCVDLPGIRVSGSIRRANFKYIYPVQKRITGYSRLKYTIDLMAFDCKDHRQRTDHVESYYDDGRVTKSSGNEDPVLWDPIRPDTDSSANLDLICNWTGT